jgi:aldehyde dehydrogenase (NAD+)
VQSSVKAELINKLKKYIIQFYGMDATKNKDFSKIINEKHFHRLLSLMEGEEIVIGGQFSEEKNKIAPTILDHVSWNSAICRKKSLDRSFLSWNLPVRGYYSADQCTSEAPGIIFLYYHKANERKVIRHISYGGGCINDTLMHLASTSMPFGGVGESGMGRYHGKDSFDTFTIRKVF